MNIFDLNAINVDENLAFNVLQQDSENSSPKMIQACSSIDFKDFYREIFLQTSLWISKTS